MGETGPCGPCSELHYYRGANLAGNTAALVNGPGDDTLEIWNLVFMQFERDASGKMTPLPRPSVDTGAGLERITAILQGANNNFDTDLFAPILRKLEELSGQKYRGGMAPEDAPFRVIADHVRAATMLVADGALPSNEGRGYVLRRILRRAMRYGRRLGLDHPFLHRLAPVVVEGFAGVYFEPANGGLDREDGGGRPRARGGALRPHPFGGRRPRRRGDRAPAPRGGDGPLGRDGLPFLRHLRDPARGHRGDRRRRRRGGRPGRLRGGHGAAAGRLARVPEVRRRRRLGLREAGAAGTALGLPGISRTGLRQARRRARPRDRAGRARGLAARARPERRRRLRPDGLLSGGRRPGRRQGHAALGRRRRPRSWTCRSRCRI